LITAISVELDSTIAADATNVSSSTTVSSPLERLSVEKLHQRTISTCRSVKCLFLFYSDT